MEKIDKAITFKGGPLTLVGNETKVGSVAPDFTVIGNALNPVKLSDYKGKVVILSVFPSLDTPVCANQVRTFNKEASELGDDAVVLCISNDLPFAQGRFCGAEGIDRVITVSDHRDLDFSSKYGFVLKELRLLARGVVVIDKQGVVKYVEYVGEVTDDPNFASALSAAKAAI